MKFSSLAKVDENPIHKDMVKSKHELSLIKGDFTPSDARERVIQLIMDNLNYHSLRNLSSRERYGQSDLNSEEKIEELQMSKKQALDLFDYAEVSGRRLRIESTIKISLV